MQEKEVSFLKHIVENLVSKPEKVKIKRSVDEMGVLLELEVAPEDVGKVIGKAGQAAKAMRTLLRILGAKESARINLKINAPEKKSI